MTPDIWFGQTCSPGQSLADPDPTAIFSSLGSLKLADPSLLMARGTSQGLAEDSHIRYPHPISHPSALGPTVILNFLFSYWLSHRITPDGSRAQQMALHTLKMMANGGIRDHVGQVRGPAFPRRDSQSQRMGAKVGHGL